MYGETDLTIFNEHIDKLEERLLARKNVLLEPTLEKQKAIESTVFDFVRDNKRKIYGGTAPNKLISVKNKADAFYPEDQLVDIDFYSPEPIEDAIKLVNILIDKGYNYVSAGEAVHKGTYSVFAEFEKVADISYVPKNIYHRMPFVELDGIYYTAPSFIMIDMYRILTDPLVSGDFRWKKTFPRIVLLQKHYPFNKATSGLPKLDQIKVADGDKKIVEGLRKTVYDFLINRDSAIVTGNYAYNQFLKESGIMKDKTLGSKYRELNTPYYEFTSTNYKDDAKELISLLRDKVQNPMEVTVVEYYPFWQLLGYSAQIKYKDYVLAHIMDYNRRCTPIKTIKIDKNSNIQIGAYDYNFLINIIMTFKHRVDKDNEKYQFRNIMTSHLIEMRNYYFKKNGKNMLDKTLFEEMIVECIGHTIHPLKESRIDKDKRAKAGKLVTWSYRPEKEGKKDPVSLYKFSNTSGNAIHNIKNLRLIDGAKIDHSGDMDRDRSREGDEDLGEELEEDEIDSDFDNI